MAFDGDSDICVLLKESSQLAKCSAAVGVNLITACLEQQLVIHRDIYLSVLHRHGEAVVLKAEERL